VSLDLEAIKARAEAATHVSAERVEWDASGPVVGYYHGGRWFRILEANSWEGDDVDCAVAEFIAHARTDVPALVAEVERLQYAEAVARSLDDWRLEFDRTWNVPEPIRQAHDAWRSERGAAP
jgi:hypothetical protein